MMIYSISQPPGKGTGKTEERGLMRGKLTLLATVCAGAIAFPAYAQNAKTDDSETIVVTAQRTAEKLQDVPIAVSAFSSEALEKQQIKNTSDLQLTLPNVTFTKTNFTSSSFTIRGIGDLCVGVTCDQATAIHMNDAPLFGSRIFEGEFYDMAQIEVLRGPQGTLYGRNATSGVVNLKTARPSLTGLAASAEAEYGNYNAVKVKGMVNVPVGDIAAVRLAGFYLNRDGYTKNLYDNSKIDGRDMYGLRGSIRIEPSSGTTIDLMAQYFHEKDDRMRIQKQYCQRDPTGVMGCLNSTRDTSMTNANSTLGAILTSKQFFAVAGLGGLSGLALGDLYGTDAYHATVNPSDPRVVNTAFRPQYSTSEWIVQGSIDQELGSGLSLKVSGNYQDIKLESQQDYNNAIQDRSLFANGLNNLAAIAGGAYDGALPGISNYFKPIANALIPNGPNGVLCTSLPDPNLAGVYAGQKICSMSPLQFDRSNDYQNSWTAEAVLSSKWDGPFNFLLGGIYGKVHVTESSYYVDSFGLDYATGIIGAAKAYGLGLPTTGGISYYLASPFYRNQTDDMQLKSYGLFGEAYYKFNDKLKLTLGLRYNHDEKSVTARTSLASWLAPTGLTNAASSPFIAAYDADPGCPDANNPQCAGITATNQLFQFRKVKSGEWTGRAVIDYAITPDNLVYASYSRGYKSGGINPPLSPIFAVSDSFKPEFVNAFEVGSKNTFGKVQLNLTGFYYDYKDLQLSRIVARTSVNDNVSAKIYGLEAEAVMHPTPELTLNMNASYLHTEVSQNKWLANPRDFGGGRADAVIIKDITNAANCAVASSSGSAAGVNGYVNYVNGLINAGAIPGVPGGEGLQNTTAFPAGSGLASTGAFSVCGVLKALAPTVGAAFGGIQTDVVHDGATYSFDSGIPVNIKGNKLPGAPDYKFSAGVQYAAPVGEMTVTPRVDFIYTGKSYGNIFNGAVNEVPSYTQVNAQIQLDGPEKKWFARAWVQNLFDKNSITGLYVTDQSSGNFTNVFTLEPRRYGISAGVKF